jgi:hypothetical protein
LSSAASGFLNVTALHPFPGVRTVVALAAACPVAAPAIPADKRAAIAIVYTADRM